MVKHLDIRSKDKNHKFPNWAVNSKIINFNNFAKRQSLLPQRKDPTAWKSWGHALNRIQKDYITLVKSHTLRKRLPSLFNHWNLAANEFSYIMRRILYNHNHEWERRGYIVFKDLNAFVTDHFEREPDPFLHIRSIVISDFNLFAEKYKYSEKSKLKTWMQARKKIGRQFQEAIGDTEKLDPPWSRALARINREYFHRPPNSWSIAEDKVRKHFAELQNEALGLTAR